MSEAGAPGIYAPRGLGLGLETIGAWLLGILWPLKMLPGARGLRQLRRVLVQESASLLSVLMIFLMVLFVASVAVYYLERDVQPGTFGSIRSKIIKS